MTNFANWADKFGDSVLVVLLAALPVAAIAFIAPSF